jgi:1-deoxy-D-xylulose-5-phosphate reductoisomerase
MHPKSSVAIFGSTGSIGTQTLEVIRLNSERFYVESLSAYSNQEILIQQINEFKPKRVVIGPKIDRHKLIELFGSKLEVLDGVDGLIEMASSESLDIVMMAIVGFSAFPPLLAAIRSGKKIALANKESIISAGSIIKEELTQFNSVIIPVDSEHNSIYQALEARPLEPPRRIMITASGGPFLHKDISTLSSVTVEEAIKHPRWNMGPKISIDSATLMNKGLEVIEACVLFDLPEDRVEVLINPQSFIHGLVEYEDASTIAVCYSPTMQVPIAHALFKIRSNFTGYIEKPVYKKSECNSKQSGASFIDTKVAFDLNFIPPCYERFPMLKLAREASRIGGNAPLILNASNELAVEAFMQRRLLFTQISEFVEKCISSIEKVAKYTIEEVQVLDLEAKRVAKEILDKNY